LQFNIQVVCANRELSVGYSMVTFHYTLNSFMKLKWQAHDIFVNFNLCITVHREHSRSLRFSKRQTRNISTYTYIVWISLMIHTLLLQSAINPKELC